MKKSNYKLQIIPLRRDKLKSKTVPTWRNNLKSAICSFVLICNLQFAICNYVSGDFYIQTGIFNDRESAVNQQVYLASRNYSVSLVTNGHYKVVVGPFAEKEKADFAMLKLASQENISTVLVDTPVVEKIVTSSENEIDVSNDVLSEMVNVAFNFLGVTYKYGGMNVEKGIDCSYFVQTVYKSFGTLLPRTSRLQFNIGKKVRKDELSPGDLVFFKKHPNGSRISHVGMYIGNDEFIHASLGAKKVTVSSLDETYYKKRFAGARRPL